MKYLACFIPMLFSVEALSLLCLCVMIVMALTDIAKLSRR